MPATAMRAVYDSGFVLGRGSAADFWALLRERSGLEGEDDVLTLRILDGFIIPGTGTFIGIIFRTGGSQFYILDKKAG